MGAHWCVDWQGLLAEIPGRVLYTQLRLPHLTIEEL